MQAILRAIFNAETLVLIFRVLDPWHAAPIINNSSTTNNYYGDRFEILGPGSSIVVHGGGRLNSGDVVPTRTPTAVDLDETKMLRDMYHLDEHVSERCCRAVTGLQVLTTAENSSDRAEMELCILIAAQSSAYGGIQYQIIMLNDQQSIKRCSP